MEDCFQDSIWSHQCPSCFSGSCQRDTLRDMLDQFVFIYLDGIPMLSPEVTCVQHVCQVLQHLLDNQLFVEVKKCEFHATTVTFVGFISQNGIQMDPSKVSAVSDWPMPTSCKLVQRFLGFANFYSGSSETLAPKPLLCML